MNIKLLTMFLLTLTFACASDEKKNLAGDVSPAAKTNSSSNSPTPVFRAVAVEELPHYAENFTQGFTIADGILYESTGQTGESRLLKIDLESRRVLQEVFLPRNQFGEGSTVFEDKVFYLTWKNGVCHVYDAATLEIQRKFFYSGEGWGLTHDGTSLIMSDGSNVLSFRKPNTFEVERTITVNDGSFPVGNLNELEYIKGEIWANVWMTDSIVRIDPATGKVNSWVDASALYPSLQRNLTADVLNGIAYDEKNDRIYLTGKNWDKMFVVKIEKVR